MSAAEKIINSDKPKKMGILAGGGHLPSIVINACKAQGIDVFIVAFEGHTRSDILDDHPHVWTRMGAVGKILRILRSEGISDLVMIGNVRRPSLKELRPDLKAAAFFAKTGFKAFGDDGLLKSLRHFLEVEGFKLHGAHTLAQQLLAPEGTLTTRRPIRSDLISIERGIEVLEGLSALDVGQAVVVQEGLVLGVEAVEGTDALIERCGSLKRSGRGGVLIKLCKVDQDRDLDLPTIGPSTVERCVEAGLSGIIIHAGQSLLLHKEEVIELANRHKLFLTSINPNRDIRSEYL
tara:strand:+ start:2655 stop:3530 length:876 start_codon:yes stop_codon:yes gene_type:complete